MELDIKWIYCSLLIFFISCNQKSKNTDSVKSDTSFINTDSKEDVIVLGENENCSEWLNSIDKKILFSLCRQFSTSTVEDSDEYKSYFELKDQGTLGHYSLFYKSKSGILELGELIVFTRKEPESWTFFDESEKNLSITLKDSMFKLNEYLFVGQNVDEILPKFNGDVVNTNHNYKLENDCEVLEMKVDSFKNVTEIKLYTRYSNP